MVLALAKHECLNDACSLSLPRVLTQVNVSSCPSARFTFTPRTPSLALGIFAGLVIMAAMMVAAAPITAGPKAMTR